MPDKVFGFELLIEQATDDVAAEISWMCSEAKGDSEIERLLLASILIRIRFGFSEYTSVIVETAGEFDNLRSQNREMTLFITPQAQLKFGRVDFLVRAFNQRLKEWRSLVIECDGHDFHERTKQQATRDKSRDRAATLNGYECFRFTGSEIWKDPWRCATEVLDWATKDWGS